MHCVLTADLASLLSEHGPAIMCGRDTIASKAVALYWTASRNRVDLWHQALARYRRAEASGDFVALRNWWRDHVVVMEEVLVTEILTRVIAVLAAGLESEGDADEIAPVTHAVHLSHVETRNRVQRIMLYGRGNSIEDAVRLNRLRRAVERWTDAMVGRISTRSALHLQYAFDSQRAAQYGEDMNGFDHDAARSTAMWLMNASMHDTLLRRTSTRAGLPQANRNVVESVLRMLRPSVFDGLGTVKSLWLQRLETSDRRGEQAVLAPQAVKVPPGAVDAPDSDYPHLQRWYQ